MKFAQKRRKRCIRSSEHLLLLFVNPAIFAAANNRKAAMPAQKKFHHNVYVILLDSSVLRHRSVLRLNPKRNPARPCIYVGMTGLPVEHRFENHKHGYKSAWVVEKYGVRLLPELFAHLNPMPFEAAAQMEMDLAEDLRAEGYTVTGGK